MEADVPFMTLFSLSCAAHSLGKFSPGRKTAAAHTDLTAATKKGDVWSGHFSVSVLPPILLPATDLPLQIKIVSVAGILPPGFRRSFLNLETLLKHFRFGSFQTLQLLFIPLFVQVIKPTLCLSSVSR